MLFTTSQVRSIIGLPHETLRYWRQKLPPLSKKVSGKAARFEVGEILALLAVSKLVNGLRVDVGAITPFAGEIFDVCKRPTIIGNFGWLCIDVEQAKAFIVNDRTLIPGNTALILLPIYEMALALRTALLRPDESGGVQTEFAWPLTVVK
jgi:MerR HTH family regulatory protein